MGAQAAQVREDVLNRIMNRKLMPGDRIDEDDIRARLELSVTPVREALIGLEQARVIERRPRGGAWVAGLDLEGLIKLTETLAEVEGAIASLAARRINKSQADALLLAVRTCLSTASSPGASSDYYDANLSFHTALIQAAGNEHLEGVALGLGNRLIAYLAARHALPGQPERSARDHEEICRAVLDADSDLSRALMVRHVNFNDVSGIDIMNGLETARR